MAATNLVAHDEHHVATMLRFALRMQQEAAQVRERRGGCSLARGTGGAGLLARAEGWLGGCQRHCNQRHCVESCRLRAEPG
jgi:hypothetical protein